jgi:hypothetical protein
MKKDDLGTLLSQCPVLVMTQPPLLWFSQSYLATETSPRSPVNQSFKYGIFQLNVSETLMLIKLLIFTSFSTSTLIVSYLTYMKMKSVIALNS